MSEELKRRDGTDDTTHTKLRRAIERREVAHLEEAFGNGRCGYSGNSLFWPKRDRIRNCKCEECADSFKARWPMVDGSGGCSWSRISWPKGFATVNNPLSRRSDLLAPDRGGDDAQLPGKGE